MQPPPPARRTRRSSPSDEAPTGPNGLSPDAHSTTSNESFYSLSPELAHSATQNGSGVGRPWNRVDALLQRDFAREKKAGKLSFERKVELYGEKLEEKLKEYEEKLLCKEEELLLKGRELQRTDPPQNEPSALRLKAENYLLNCRVETISSPSSKAPKIFHTSPEHPNARIIITPPYGPSKGRPSSAPSSGDIFDPRLPSKPAARRPTLSSAISDDNILRRTSGRKRTITEKYDDGSSDTDSLLEEGYAKPKKVKRENKEPSTANSTPTESRRRKSSTKLLESAESTPKKKDGVGRPPSSSKSNREKEARLDRRENEELYEALQKQVTIDLLKRRGIPTSEQEEMVMDICRKLGVDSNTDLATRAATSVRYWVAHKSWRLRDHFKVIGQRYKSAHRNENWTSSLPPISAVKPLTNQSEVERWLFQSLGMRLATRRMMSNPDIRRALWIVFVGCLRYGIRAAYDGTMTSPVFQSAVESLDKFTKDFEYPVNETTGFRGKMKVVKGEDGVDEEEEEDPLEGIWEFDWTDAEALLVEAQGG